MKNILEGPNSRLDEQKRAQWLVRAEELIKTQQQKKTKELLKVKIT